MTTKRTRKSTPLTRASAELRRVLKKKAALQAALDAMEISEKATQKLERNKPLAQSYCTVEQLEALISKYDGALVVIRRKTTSVLTVESNRASVYLNRRPPRAFQSVRTLAQRLAVFGLTPDDYVVVSTTV
jgi:DNA repair exonuclease SbcCD ATPase subunit